MRQFFDRLLTIAHSDQEIRRRGRNTVVLALGIIILALLFIPVTFQQENALFAQLIILLGILILLGVIWLARQAHVTEAALLLIIANISGFGAGIAMTPNFSSGAFLISLSVLMASLTLRPKQIWSILAICEIVLVVGYVVFPKNQINPGILIGIILMPVLVALMGFLGAQSTSLALQAAQTARNEAEAAAQALEATNTNLEATVSERTREVQAALAEVQRRVDEQTRLLDEVEAYRLTIRDLSVPVIPITETTLVMPLVGALDSTRILQIQEQALQSLETWRARHLILDITGVPLVDSQVALGLLTVVRSAKLLGTEVMLVGIRPEVAQSIVGLGVQLGELYTASNLQMALSHIGLRSAEA
ncbi:MAG TPA: STAS domain-containing protein [Herpetosiphonaceae bacterium]